MSDWCQGCKHLLADGKCKYWGNDTYATSFCSIKYDEQEDEGEDNGDYIKREDAVARIADCHRGGIEAIKEDYSIDRFCEGLSDAIDAVNDAPAADVEPVKHGHWIKGENLGTVTCKCSECHYIDYVPLHDSYYWLHRNYCPNCGTKMDGKEQEHEEPHRE